MLSIIGVNKINLRKLNQIKTFPLFAKFIDFCGTRLKGVNGLSIDILIIASTANNGIQLPLAQGLLPFDEVKNFKTKI